MDRLMLLDPNGLIVVILGCLLLGLILLFARSENALYAPALLLSLWSLPAMLFLRDVPAYWRPTIFLAAVASFLLLLRRAPILSPLNNRHLLGASLLLAGAVFLVGIAAPSAEPDPKTSSPDRNVVKSSAERPAIDYVPLTDRGYPVSFSVLREAPRPGAESNRIRRWAEKPGVVRTGPPDPTYNCHGWVFAGGLGWVYPESVDQILRENGYHVVVQPRVGDVICYRDESDLPMHTGIVHATSIDGQILIESKWGLMGRYIHGPADQPCGSNYRYYRSARNGHLLRDTDREQVSPLAE
jgi:hypothetical protein